MRRASFLFPVLLLAVLLLPGCSSSRGAGGLSGISQTTIVFFSSSSCSECREVTSFLDQLVASGVPLKIHRYRFEDTAHVSLRHSLDLLYNVPEKNWYVVPAVFVGRTVLIRAGQIKARLPHLLETATAQENGFLLEHLAAGARSSSRLSSSFSVGTVLGAGLIDGINPCAFATLLFFLSYIILRSGSRRRILRTGCSFAAGIFCSYFLMGLGLERFVAGTAWFATAARWLYGLLGLLSAFLAILSLRDMIRTLYGSPEQMTLQLPGREKSGIRSLIRQAAGSAFLPSLAFLIALPIALLEFLCTGQTYLPTIVLIIANEGLRSHAVLLLLLYNLLFILPLLLITILAAEGMSSERLRSWFTHHLALSELLSTLLFAVFALLFLLRWGNRG